MDVKREKFPEMNKFYPEELDEFGNDKSARQFKYECLIVTLTLIVSLFCFSILIPITYKRPEITYYILPYFLLYDNFF